MPTIEVGIGGARARAPARRRRVADVAAGTRGQVRTRPTYVRMRPRPRPRPQPVRRAPVRRALPTRAAFGRPLGAGLPREQFRGAERQAARRVVRETGVQRAFPIRPQLPSYTPSQRREIQQAVNRSTQRILQTYPEFRRPGGLEVLRRGLPAPQRRILEVAARLNAADYEERLAAKAVAGSARALLPPELDMPAPLRRVWSASGGLRTVRDIPVSPDLSREQRAALAVARDPQWFVRGLPRERIRAIAGAQADYERRSGQRLEPGYKPPEQVAGVAGPLEPLVQLGQAFVEAPGQTAATSWRTLREGIAGFPQAVKLAASPDEPGGGLGGLASAAVEDVQRRYETVYSDPAEFRRRVREEYGLTPYALDIAALAGGGGRLAGGLARRGVLGGPAERLASEPRPALRFSPGPTGVRQQRLSRNLITAGLQRRRDVRRQAEFEAEARAAGHRTVEARGPSGATSVYSVGAAPGREIGDFPNLRALRPEAGEVVARRGEFRELPFARGLVGRVERSMGAMKGATRLGLLAEQSQAERSAVRAVNSVPKELRPALKPMIEMGIPASANAVRAMARRRLVGIQAERRRPGVPAVKREREVPVLRDMVEHPERYADPKLRQAANTLRQLEVQLASGDPAFGGYAALRRRYAPLREVLDVRPDLEPEFSVKAAERAIRRAGGPKEQARMAQLVRSAASQEQRRGASTELPEREDRQLVLRAVQAAREAGLQAPGYWPSRQRGRAERSLRTAGAGMRAVRGEKRYTGALFRRGEEDIEHDAFVQSLMRNIKRRYSWDLVGRNVQMHVFDWSRGKSRGGLTMEEMQRRMYELDIDPEDVAFFNVRKFFRDRELLDDAAEALTSEMEGGALHESVKAAMRVDPGDPATYRGQAMNRYFAVPREVGAEIENATQAGGILAKGWEVAMKSIPSRVILGLANVPWLTFQIASNASLSLLSGANPFDIVGAIRWWRQLTPEQRRAIEPYIGVGPYHGDAEKRYMGSTIDRAPAGRMDPRHWMNAWRAFRETTLGKTLFTVGDRRVTAERLNPIDMFLRADAAQNNMFRRWVFYSKAKREAGRAMGREMQGAGALQARLFGDGGPFEEGLLLPVRGERLIANQRLLEEHAEHVRRWLGNYESFTALERRYLSRNIMFYGFLRFSLRFTLYTMPVGHPITTAILSQLGRLGADDVKRLLGTDPQVPVGKSAARRKESVPVFALSSAIWGKPGDLKAAPFGRMHPMLNALASIQGPNQLLGLLSPVIGVVVDQMGHRSMFRDREWRVNGLPTPPESQQPAGYFNNMGTRGRVMLQTFLRMVAPYRAAEEHGIPGIVEPMLGPQGDDSLLFSQRPLTYARGTAEQQETAADIEEQKRRQRSEADLLGLLRSQMPFIPRRTAVGEIMEREREKREKERKRVARAELRRRGIEPPRGSGGGGDPWGGGAWGGGGGGGGGQSEDPWAEWR